jgi:hypothetical protein
VDVTAAEALDACHGSGQAEGARGQLGARPQRIVRFAHALTRLLERAYWATSFAIARRPDR